MQTAFAESTFELSTPTCDTTPHGRPLCYSPFPMNMGLSFAVTNGRQYISEGLPHQVAAYNGNMTHKCTCQRI